MPFLQLLPTALLGRDKAETSADWIVEKICKSLRCLRT